MAIATKLPPVADFKEEADKEHRRAELQRLEAGFECCGCDSCQKIYKSLDLEKYGSRVIRVGGVVLIREKSKKVADKILEPSPTPSNLTETHHNQKLDAAKVVMVHPVFMQHGIKIPKKIGRPEKRGRVHRVTNWRRGRKKQGVLL